MVIISSPSADCLRRGTKCARSAVLPASNVRPDFSAVSWSLAHSASHLHGESRLM
jgi:hypothetical protein